MNSEILTAVIAAAVAIISAVVSIYSQIRITRLADHLAKQRETESREVQNTILVSKYRDPLLRSTIDLQSRLFNIVKNGWLQRLYNRSQSDKNYAIDNTLYVIAEYFGWVETLRREIQFLDLGDLEKNRQLSELLVNINQAFGTDKLESTFRLFTGEQRAIGEIMLLPRAAEGTTAYECIGYALFVKKMDDPEFSRWFANLKNDLAMMVTEKYSMDRLILIHHKLIDLIDFLDPNCVRVPVKYRSRL